MRFITYRVGVLCYLLAVKPDSLEPFKKRVHTLVFVIGFKKSTLAKIYAIIHQENAPSMKVADKLSMKFEKRECEPDGTEVSCYVVERGRYATGDHPL